MNQQLQQSLASNCYSDALSVLSNELVIEQQAAFVYDLDKLARHLEQLQQQSVIKLWYAVKANPLSSVIQHLDRAGFNFDVASQGELEQVLQQGVDANRILNTGPAKSKVQLRRFLATGVNTFVIESHRQLSWLHEAATELAIKPKVLLRVQLRWPDDDKNPLGGNHLTPFGLSVDDWSGIRVTDFPSVEFIGLHIFQWGNMLSNQKLCQLWQHMVPPLQQLAENIGMNLQVLDLGGGLGLDYADSGQELSWQQIIADLDSIKQQAGATEIWLELGRYAVGQCGHYLVPVVDRKINFGEQQLVLAAGINHLLRPAITEQPFPVTLLRSSEHQQQIFNIHGPLCTSLDQLGSLSLPADTDVDDVLCFGLCGAYGFTESMPFFLCHAIAAEYVWQQGSLQCVREPQSAQWYLR